MSVLVAVESFAAPGGVVVTAGDVFDSTDPIVKGRESLFETTEAAIARRAEVVYTAADFAQDDAEPVDEDKSKAPARTRKG